MANVRCPQEDAMVQAYILVQTEVGRAADVARQIAEIAGVMQAEDVTGPYDVIVRASAENVDELGKLVAAQIQAVEGITRTRTSRVSGIWGYSPRTEPRPEGPRMGAPPVADPRLDVGEEVGRH